MFKKILNLKKETDDNKKNIHHKIQLINEKKNTIKEEYDKWGKKQTKKNFP